MKLIREPDLSNALKQYFNSESVEEAKLSYYTYFQKVADDKIVLYNFISNAIALLNKNEFEIISGGKFAGKNQLYSELQKNGFFAKKDLDEKAVLENQRKTMRDTTLETLRVMVLPTTNCNARCSYCVGQKNQRTDMMVETAKATVDFVLKKALKYKKVHFNWYGGEPLLKHGLITMMCGEFRSKAPKVTYSSVITTNLAALDDEILDSAINIWHIKKFNVTLDGTEQEHNSRKRYIDKTLNGYQKTIHFIEKILARGVAVNCRFNVDKNNIDDLDAILHDIKPFFDNKLFSFYVTSLRSADSVNDYFRTSEYDEIAYRTYSSLINNGIKPSVDSLVPKLAAKSCLAKTEDSLVVGADGSIYMCTECQKNTDNAIGDVFSGTRKNKAYSSYMNTNLPKECVECKFLPICQGGCPEHRKNASDTNSPCCKFRFTIESVSKILAEHYSG